MTQDEIIKDLKEILARDIGYTTWTISTPHLVSLVNKAIESEREACAERAWVALVKHKQPWNVRQDIVDVITERNKE